MEIIRYASKTDIERFIARDIDLDYLISHSVIEREHLGITCDKNIKIKITIEE